MKLYVHLCVKLVTLHVTLVLLNVRKLVYVKLVRNHNSLNVNTFREWKNESACCLKSIGAFFMGKTESLLGITGCFRRVNSLLLRRCDCNAFFCIKNTQNAKSSTESLFDGRVW